MTNEQVNKNIRALPIWVRAPKTGDLEYFTGLSRAKLYELEREGKIRGGSLKEPHEEKGTHVFHLQSILDFIESTIQPG